MMTPALIAKNATARRRPARLSALVLALLATAACDTPPELAGTETSAARGAAPPALLPVDGLLAQAETGTLTAETGEALAARGAALRRRANAIAPDTP